MQRTTVRKVKFLGACEDDREEEWLRQMGKNGYHLQELPFPCFYTFLRGSPRDDAYRLDFITTRNRAEFQQYLRIFRDAGWEHLGQMGN